MFSAKTTQTIYTKINIIWWQPIKNNRKNYPNMLNFLLYRFLPSTFNLGLSTTVPLFSENSDPFISFFLNTIINWFSALFTWFFSRGYFSRFMYRTLGPFISFSSKYILLLSLFWRCEIGTSSSLESSYNCSLIVGRGEIDSLLFPWFTLLETSDDSSALFRSFSVAAAIQGLPALLLCLNWWWQFGFCISAVVLIGKTYWIWWQWSLIVTWFINYLCSVLGRKLLAIFLRNFYEQSSNPSTNWNITWKYLVGRTGKEHRS